jgi:ribosomal-protein-alanine N-acetyltransferase
MELRPFIAADLRTLYEIDQACFPPGISYSHEELVKFIAQPNSKTWVAVEHDRIIGFLVAERQPRRVGHIITIDVLEAWRRRGVGKALMGAAEDWAGRQGLLKVYLETAEDNVTAQRFYESRGYRKVDVVEHYYSNGSAAWVMAKRIA